MFEKPAVSHGLALKQLKHLRISVKGFIIVINQHAENLQVIAGSSKNILQAAVKSLNVGFQQIQVKVFLVLEVIINHGLGETRHTCNLIHKRTVVAFCGKNFDRCLYDFFF